MKIELPHIDAAQQRLFDITGGAGRHFPVRFGNDLWRLDCSSVPDPWIPEISIPLNLAGEVSVLELAFTPGGRLFDRHAEFRDIAAHSEPFALAIRATLSRELLDSLQTSLDASVAIAQEPHNTLPPLAMAFEIMDSSGQREGRGVLRVGPEMLSRIEGLSVSWKSEPNPSLASITHSVALCVCAFDISAGELATLRLGDCMILGEVSAWPFPLWISTGAAPIPIGFPPIAALPLSLQSSTPSTMNPTEPATSPLSNLKLPLLVVAGRKEMTLEQLASLRQGASLEIGSGENIPVELEVNNQVVATGHLVRVADKICASITEIRSLPTA